VDRFSGFFCFGIFKVSQGDCKSRMTANIAAKADNDVPPLGGAIVLLRVKDCRPASAHGPESAVAGTRKLS